MNDHTYSRERADDEGRAARRSSRRSGAGYTPDRRDPAAPIIALISGGEAACADLDPDLWFDSRSTPELKALCHRCPLRRGCLEYALIHDVAGIWGGTTALERDELRQRHRISKERVVFSPYLRQG